MEQHTRTITVFGSSRPRDDQDHHGYRGARQLGAELAAGGFAVCSGGYGGVMEAVSRGAKNAGGRVIGVTAEFFNANANQWLDQEIRLKTWQDRLFELIKRGDGYVVCEGGTGTLVELAVVWEMMNKGIMQRKPVIVLGDFWKPVIDRVRGAELGQESPWIEKQDSLVRFAVSPTEAVNVLSAYFNSHAR